MDVSRLPLSRNVLDYRSSVIGKGKMADFSWVPRNAEEAQAKADYDALRTKAARDKIIRALAKGDRIE